MMKQRDWILCTGSVWLAMGMLLISKGIRFLSDAQLDHDSLSFRWNLSSDSTGQAWIISLAMIVGYVKARLVFVKTVQRVVTRIRSLSMPIRFSQVYTKSYWFLIGGMMMLGMVFRFLPLPVDVRGFIDLTIGSALINGAILYFQAVRIEVT